ncbi:transmembrane protein 71 [Salarias fasciatus]|nr:transmembrane protein 71 [Salarias fasciatus]
MANFFSGAVTSSPVRRRLRSSPWQSLDESLLSPDSSYVCYPSADGSEPCSCRRSPRLLTNGYYSVTEDNFSWDDQGNVSLSPCSASVSYKETLVRVFRRRRRPRGSLVSLLSDVTESCQSWLDEKVFRGIFRTGQNQDLNQEQDRGQDPYLDQDRDVDWSRSTQESLAPEDEPSWTRLNSTELENSCSFVYDPTEAPPPPDKTAPPPAPLLQEDITSETCQSADRFTQTLGGLSEVPPPSPFYTNTCCCQAAPDPPGITMKSLLLFIFTVFILTALYSRCLWWSAAVTSSVFMLITSVMVLTKSGPMGEWRRAKTEDITSRNE